MPGLRLRPLIALAAVCALAAPALAAGDRIVHGRSIGVIAVGDERATIGDRFGDGVVIARRPDPAAPGNRNFDAVTLAYPRFSLVVNFGTDEASSGAVVVATRSSRYRTVGGLGVGSTRAQILAAHPRAVCSATLCRVGPRAGDPRITRFTMAGTAVRVSVRRAPG